MATKRLALELGLVQKRDVKGSSSTVRSVAQDFEYLVVLDFESTCWESGARVGRQEIIEFPAVLLHISTGEILSEFHHYVMPVEQPILSEFCKTLTGITQEQVEAGVPLGTCLGLFSSWIRKVCDQYQMSFNTSTSCKHVTFATWSDWDLGVCLHYECTRKQLRKPEFFNQWIDIKLTYKNFYQRRPQGLAGALKDLGITFEGREHSGICDTRNTAVLISRMAKDGCALKITKSLTAKAKGNAVKEAAQKLFNQVKNVILGKRPSEEVEGKSKQSKVARPSSAVSSLPKDTKEDTNGLEVSESINFSLGLSGLISSEVDVIRKCEKESDRSAKTISKVVEKSGNATRSNVCNVGAGSTNILVNSRKAGSLNVINDNATSAKALESSKKANWLNNSSGGTKSVDIKGYHVKAGPSNVFSNGPKSTDVLDNSRKPTSLNIYKDGAKLAKGLESSRKPTSIYMYNDAKSAKGLETSRKPTSLNIYNDGAKSAEELGNSKKAGSVNVSKDSVKPVKVLTHPLRSITNIVKSRDSLRSVSTTPKSLGISKAHPFKTPVLPVPKSSNVSIGLSKSVLKTPMPESRLSASSAENDKSIFKYKKTPPFCGCGRRAKLLLASKPGPNEGRYFFSCPNGGTGNKRNCKFFKWEDEPFVTASTINSFCVPYANSTFKLSAHSLPVQRAVKVDNLVMRGPQTAPEGSKKPRCVGLSRNVPQFNVFQENSGRSVPKSNNIGILNRQTNGQSSVPLEITPHIVREKPRSKCIT